MADDYAGSAQATVVQALYTMDGAPGDMYDPTSAEMVERHAAHILAALDAAGYAVLPAASEPATPASLPSVAVCIGDAPGHLDPEGVCECECPKCCVEREGYSVCGCPDCNVEVCGIHETDDAEANSQQEEDQHGSL